MTRAFFAAALVAAGLATTATAQVGTYRPGQPYTALPSPNADSCERTCAGDAGCRGWNWVALQTAGVCELNSRDAAPVASPNATSGTAPGALRPASNRVVRVPDGSTLRIGSPEPVRPARPQARRIVTPPPRRVAPQAASVAARPAPAAAMPTRPITARPMPPKPQFRHTLDSVPSPIRPSAGSLAVPRPQPMPQRPAPNMAAQRPPQPAHAPQQAAPQPTIPPQAAPRPNAPVLAGPPRPATQDGLFGSLYDDVSAPAPADPASMSDPDAPVATATDVPVGSLR